MNFGLDNKIKYIESIKSPLVLMPNHPFLKVWSFFMLFLMMYVATFLPYSICFFKPSDGKVHTLEIADSIIDFLFMIDICVNFISSYEDPELHLPVVLLKSIAKNYISGFFFLDIIAIIPF